jgi:transposase
MMAPELRTLITAFLPPRCAVGLSEVTVEQASGQLHLTATAPTACGPCCTVLSSSIHSRYQRRLTDVPWGTRAVQLQLTVRKFRCRNPSGARRIFTERLPDLVAAYGRHTPRLATALRAVGLARGGNAGARLAARLRLPTSPSTLLRLVRGIPIPPMPALRAVGVDEWAWRRGHRYGTILVDVATHRVVDLLPDRSAATLAAWLARQPTITVVSRDRRDLYADGIRRGAPEAVQVVDRFHRGRNLREAIEAFLVTQRPVLQAAAMRMVQALASSTTPVPVTPRYTGKRQCSHTRRQQQAAAQQRRHAPWVTTYEAIHTRSAQEAGITTIARQLGISRPTVYAYLRQGTPPAPRSPQRSGQVLRPYLPYLIRRWREGVTDSMRLWREIQAQGDPHSARTVCRFITRLRRATEVGQAPETQASPYTRPQGPSARAVSCIGVCPDAKRSSEARRSIDHLTQVDRSMAQADHLSQACLTLVRERRGHALEAWIRETMRSGNEALARLARGLPADLAAVKAGLTLPWSNGPVEGQITRLKLLKRQGDGRAGFPLLRQRVMPAA